MTLLRRRFAALVRLAVCTVTALVLGVGIGTRPATARAIGKVATADTQHVTIKVDGMFCESCEATVHAMLKRTRGVYSAKVDVKRGAAFVAYDPTKTTPRDLVDVINRLGYKATLPPAGKAKASG